MPLKIVILTQHAPLYIGPFFDHWLSKLDRDKFVVESIVAFSPIFKKTTIDEMKARLDMYGLGAFINILALILKEKLKAWLYQTFKIGQCSSISNISKKYQIPIIKFNNPNDKVFHDYIKNKEIDLLISIACPKILKLETIQLAKKSCINYHTGALPKYRGRQPLFWAKLNKEKEIGITVHEMVPALDAGEILSQKFIENEESDSLHNLYLKSIKVGPEVLLEALHKLYFDDPSRKSNPDSEATKFSFPKASDGKNYRDQGLRFI